MWDRNLTIMIHIICAHGTSFFGVRYVSHFICNRAAYRVRCRCCCFFFFTHIYFPASGQAVVTGIVSSPPRFLPSIFIAHRVQQSHCSSIFHRVLLTHALALSASQIVHKKKSQRIDTSEYALGGVRTHETDLYQAR